jgi:hypothetical protein
MSTPKNTGIIDDKDRVPNALKPVPPKPVLDAHAAAEIINTDSRLL